MRAFKIWNCCSTVAVRSPRHLRADCPWYSDSTGMIGTAQSRRIVRSAVAAHLALLLSVASLAPLAFGAAGESSSSCCRGHGKCCCRKSHSKPPAGPAFANPQCTSDCCQPAIGMAGADGFVRPTCRRVAPTYEVFSRLSVFDRLATERFSGEAHQQRPPPSSRHTA